MCLSCLKFSILLGNSNTARGYQELENVKKSNNYNYKSSQLKMGSSEALIKLEQKACLICNFCQHEIGDWCKFLNMGVLYKRKAFNNARLSCNPLKDRHR